MLPLDPEQGFVRKKGNPFGPAAPVWSYQDKPRFFSPFISGAQRLQGGNTLICEGAEGRIFEVSPEQEIVWEYLNPFGGDVTDPGRGGGSPPLALFRATRLSPYHPGLKSRLP